MNGAHPVVAVAIQAVVLPEHHSGSIERDVGAVHLRHLAGDWATGRIPVGGGVAHCLASVRIGAADLVCFTDTAGICCTSLVT